MERHTHEVGQWIPRYATFTDSECTIEIANTSTQSAFRRVHDSILMEDAMTGEVHGRRNPGDQSLPTVPSGRMSLRYLHSCRLDDRSRTASTTAKGHLPKYDQGPRQGLPGSARGQCGDSSSNRIRVIPRAIDLPDIRAMERPGPKMACILRPISQMLCQQYP
jgi:hypothetical protein